MPNWRTVNDCLSALEALTTPDWDAENKLLIQLAQEMGILRGVDLINAIANDLNPEQRAMVIEGLIGGADATFSQNLVMLVFGLETLEDYLKRSQRAYPDFDLVMGIAWSKRHEYLEAAAFWHPRKGGPAVDPETDFMWKPTWDTAEHFWHDGKSQVEDFLLAYPTQSSFTLRRKAQPWELELDPDPSLFFVKDLVKDAKTKVFA